MRPPRAGVGATVAAWIVLIAAPFLLSDWQLTQFSELISYGIFAMSLAFVWGQAGLLCFGQAIFFGIGAYLMALVTKGMLPGFPNGTAIGLIAATLVPVLSALVTGPLMFRGRGLSGAYFAIVTLAAAVIVERVASHWEFIGGFNGLLNVPPLHIGFGSWSVDLLDTTPVYYALLVATAATYGILLFVERSPIGTALRAIRDNEERTAYFGFDVAVLKTLSFGIGAAIAGLAGALFATQFGFVSPALIGVPLSTEVLIWVALGGREVLLAAFLGAIVVRSVESALSARLGNYWLLGLGILFVTSVIVFPKGLLGQLLALPLPARMRRAAVPERSGAPSLSGEGG